jgi:hypothetical protein
MRNEDEGEDEEDGRERRGFEEEGPRVDMTESDIKISYYLSCLDQI